MAVVRVKKPVPKTEPEAQATACSSRPSYPSSGSYHCVGSQCMSWVWDDAEPTKGYCAHMLAGLGNRVRVR